MCCFSAQQAALRRKNKDWVARDQNNVYEQGDMAIRVSVSQYYKYPTKRVGLVQSGHHNHFFKN